MSDFERKLNELKISDFIWLIYFFIIIFSLISNSLQRKYLYSKNKYYRTHARTINITLLVVAFFIYFYFVLESLDDINILKYKTKVTENQRRVALERLITTLVFLVGGALSIYTELDDQSGDIDLAIL